jgi:hypothetical protein
MAISTALTAGAKYEVRKGGLEPEEALEMIDVFRG